MSRIKILLSLIVIVIVFLFSWHLIPVRVVPFLVINKTVPDTEYTKHRAIFWLAEHLRIQGEPGYFLRAEKDYLGFHPEIVSRETLTSSHLRDIKLLYLADAYGVYSYEEDPEEYQKKLPYEEQSKTLIFGGLNPKEVSVITEFIRRPDVILVGEHNIFGYPTYLEQESSLKLQNFFGVNYHGWKLQYFSDLEKVPFRIKELYANLYGKEWNFTGSGLTVYREEIPGFGWREDLLVLTSEDLTEQRPSIYSEEHKLTTGTTSGTPYIGIMEILQPHIEAEVLAYLEIPVNEEGAEKLEQRGLSTSIPAMIYFEGKGTGSRIYFAGSFAEQPQPFLPARLAGTARIQELISYIPGIPIEYRFSFSWYYPVSRNIMEEAWLKMDSPDI